MKNLTAILIILVPLFSIGQISSRSGNLKLDSTINTTYYYNISLLDTSIKYEYEYNSFGSITSQIEYNYISVIQQWQNLRKQEYQYNTLGDLTQFTYSFWNQSTNQWDITRQGRSIYNSLNQLALHLNLIWSNSISGIDTSSKTEYTYNQSGDIESKIQTIKEPIPNIWTPSNKEEYYYDQFQQDTLYQYSDWDSLNSQWVMIGQMKNTYNSNGTHASHTEFSFDDTLLVWYLDRKNFITYNSSGKITKDSAVTWDENLQIIKNFRLNTYQYTPNGDLQEISLQYWNLNQMNWYSQGHFRNYFTQTVLDSSISRIWNPTTQVLENNDKTEYESQQNGAFTLKKRYYWNLNSQKWKASEMNEYNYDLGVPKSKLIHPDKYNAYDFLLDSTSYYQTTSTSSGWTTKKSNTTFYSPLTPNSILDAEQISVSIYPNPATDFIQFDIKNSKKNLPIFIYNIEGQLLISQLINSDGRINISSFSNGNYVYSILVNGQLVSGKILKQ